jgi:hypothetical protein
MRMQQLGAIGWKLGLSLRGASALFGAFLVQITHMSIWRDVQAWKPTKPERVRVLGVDGFYSRQKGELGGVVVAVDLGTGQPIALAQIQEKDVQAVVEWLQPLIEELGVEVIVTDDLNSHGQMVEQLGKKHQVCRFHMRRWVGKALKNLRKQLNEAWYEAIDEVERIVTDLPSDGQKLLFMLWQRIGEPRGKPDKQANALYRFRQVVLRLHNNWAKYVCFQAEIDVPATNNTTERAIEHWRTRSRSVRGFKSWNGLEAAFQLCNSPVTR